MQAIGKAEYIVREIGEDLLIMNELQKLISKPAITEKTEIASINEANNKSSFPQAPLLFE